MEEQFKTAKEKLNKDKEQAVTLTEYDSRYVDGSQYRGIAPCCNFSLHQRRHTEHHFAMCGTFSTKPYS